MTPEQFNQLISVMSNIQIDLFIIMIVLSVIAGSLIAGRRLR